MQLHDLLQGFHKHRCCYGLAYQTLKNSKLIKWHDFIYRIWRLCVDGQSQTSCFIEGLCTEKQKWWLFLLFCLWCPLVSSVAIVLKVDFLCGTWIDQASFPFIRLICQLLFHFAMSLFFVSQRRHVDCIGSLYKILWWSRSL